MSATRRPIAIEGIKKSLKLESHNISIVKGELTCPEIRIIRVQMKESMTSCGDLVSIIPRKSEVPDAYMVPTWVYNSSQNKTATSMKALDLARGTRGNSMRPKSKFVRRFHSCTGEKDKLKVVEDLAKHEFPFISCTMALAMGQNWASVQCVIQMGRTDPSSICQMISRSGRAGRPGLAIIFTEPKRRGGKNPVADFLPNLTQTNEDRMDALAITPVCLQIAFAIDNFLGYIPLLVDDPSYKQEQEREKSAGFVACMCSNCTPAEGLLSRINTMNIDNMDNMISQYWPAPETTTKTTKRKQASAGGGGKTSTGKKIKLSLPLQEMLSENLASAYKDCFDVKWPNGTGVDPIDLFGDEEIKKIMDNFGAINGVSSVRKIMGGHMVPGQFQALYKVIEDFENGPVANKESVRKAKGAASAKKKAEEDALAERRGFWTK
ncbi:hypothetical protein PSTT_03693 [Puccinia striiformis]|uniref:DNA 3'-5' helicase n=2 Tax=Puccinia striiformis TaxID=27350 RepID=A0A2S4VVJ0_9BASI|nr:hypothetical protein PSTT_03693 [Puccinia striiformis]